MTHPLTKFRETHPDRPSPEKLADDLGVSGLTVRRWEAGEVLPQKQHRPKIYEVTQLRYSDFVAFLETSGDEAAA